MTETLTIENLEFEVRYSSRRKTLGLTVDRLGELIVHAPEVTDKAELRCWIGHRLLWVNQKLLLKDANHCRERQMQPVSGETISYLGRNYRLRVVTKQEEPLAFDGHWFTLRRRDKSEIALLLQQWYQDVGQEWFVQRVARWHRKAGLTPKDIQVKTLGYRWASCSKSGVLRFNWKLLQLPIRLIDYVIVHELIHLKERNHTPAFWRILEEVLPDWQTRKDELAAAQTELVWSEEDTK